MTSITVVPDTGELDYSEAEWLKDIQDSSSRREAKRQQSPFSEEQESFISKAREAKLPWNEVA